MQFHTVTTGEQETHDSQYKGLIQSKSQKPGKLFKERKYKSHKLFLNHNKNTEIYQMFNMSSFFI